MTNTATKIQILRDALTVAYDALVDAGLSTSNDYDAQIDQINRAFVATADEALRLTEGAQDAMGEAVRMGIGPWTSADDIYMLKREIHNLKRHIEDYCQPAPKASTEPLSIWCDACGADRAKELCLREHWQGCAFVGVAHRTQPASADPAPDCTRSHPHEDMDAACEAKTAQARADYKRAVAELAGNPCASNSLERQNPQNVDGKAAHTRRAEFSGEREVLFDEFLHEEAPLDYDASNSDAWHIWQAAWQARGQQQAGVPDVATDCMLEAGGEMLYGHSRLSAIEWAKQDKFESCVDQAKSVWDAMRAAHASAPKAAP